MSLLLPSKHTSVSDSLLRQAEVLYASIDTRTPLAEAWIRCRENTSGISFGRFVLMLDILFALQIIEISDGLLYKRGPDAATT